jgi:intracellular multiplication protein IcmJ
MAFLPLVLGVRRAEAGTAPQKGGVKDAAALRKAVLDRDNFTCAWCGFRAKTGQQVRVKSGGVARGLHPDDHATACVFCDQVFALETVPTMASGALIFMPELPQADLNHLSRAIYVARRLEGTEIAGRAARALDALLMRRGEAKRRLGTDDPWILATALLENLNDAEYATRAQKLDGIRLLPLDRRMINGRDQFPSLLNSWIAADGPFADFRPEKWLETFEGMETTPKTA